MRRLAVLLWALGGCGLAHRPAAEGDAGVERADAAAQDASDADAAHSWLVAVVDGPSSGRESALVADGGDLHVVYRDLNGQDLVYAHRSAAGTWDEPAVVDGAGSVGFDPALAIDADGTLHAIYYDYGEDRLLYASRARGASWSAGEVADDGADVGVGLHGAVAVDGAGDVHAVYARLYEPHGLVYARRDDAGWLAAETIDLDAVVDARVGLAVDADGVLHASYFDLASDRLRYLERSPAGDWSEPATLTSLTDTVGSCATSLAVDDDGGVHVSYFDYDVTALGYAHRAPGGGWSEPELVDQGGVGKTSSIAVDAAGGLHLSYDDQLAGELDYAYRSPGGGWQTEVVDRDGDVGENSSLTLDGGGGVHISYYDKAERSLRVASQAP